MIDKILLIVYFLTYLTPFSWSQTTDFEVEWTHSKMTTAGLGFGEDEPDALLSPDNKHVYISWYESEFQIDLLNYSINQDGDQVWMDIYDGGFFQNEKINSVATQIDSGFLWMAGSSAIPPDYGGGVPGSVGRFLIYNLIDGALLTDWTYSYQDNEATSFETFYPLEDGNYLFLSEALIDPGPSNRQVIISKLSAENQLLWEENLFSKSIGGSALRDDTLDVLSFSGDSYFLHHLNIETGVPFSIDTNSYSGGIFFPPVFSQTNSSNFFIGSFNNGYHLTKIDLKGDTIWTYEKEQPFPGNGIDRLVFAEPDNAGNLYLGGIYWEENYGERALITKLAETGELLWEKQYDPTTLGYETITDLKVFENEVYFCGTYFDESGHSVFFAEHYSSSGEMLDYIVYDNPSFSNSLASKIIVQDAGSIYLVGRTLDNITGDWMITTVKYGIPTIEGALQREEVVAKVFPNPATDKLWISLSDRDDSLLIQIYSSDGKMIHTQLTSLDVNHFEIDLSPLQSGIYLLQWKTNDAIGWKKFLKN